MDHQPTISSAAQTTSSSVEQTMSDASPATDSNHDSTSEWNTHEHQSDRVRIQAQQLVQETGSSELAKHAIDEVAHHFEPILDQAGFARQFGFESYLAMFESSTPLTSDDGRHWLVATTTGGEWIAWNENELGVHHRFHSLEEAARLIGAEHSQIQ